MTGTNPASRARSREKPKARIEVGSVIATVAAAAIALTSFGAAPAHAGYRRGDAVAAAAIAGVFGTVAAVIAAKNQHRKVIQVGTQQRSMPQFQKAYEILKSGALGDIHKVHLTWNRNAPRAQRPNLNIDPATVDWPALTRPTWEW